MIAENIEGTKSISWFRVGNSEFFWIAASAGMKEGMRLPRRCAPHNDIGIITIYFLPNGDFPLNIVPVITEASYCYCYRFMGWRIAFSG